MKTPLLAPLSAVKPGSFRRGPASPDGAVTVNAIACLPT